MFTLRIELIVITLSPGIHKLMLQLIIFFILIVYFIIP